MDNGSDGSDWIRFAKHPHPCIVQAPNDVGRLDNKSQQVE
jgi:hypothetical protein